MQEVIFFFFLPPFIPKTTFSVLHIRREVRQEVEIYDTITCCEFSVVLHGRLQVDIRIKHFNQHRVHKNRN